ncbi:MAG: ATP-binding protein [Gemmataceae bacterium]|nr:ATP-binding protein [Gemmataceae bacterium]
MPTAIPSAKEARTEAGQDSPAHVLIPSDAGEARRVQEEIEQALKASAYSEPDIFGIKLALEEAMVNAIKHGNQLDRSKNVRIAYQVRADVFEITIADEGSGFDPEDVPDPTAPENLERCCGRGLMLMRHYMCEVSYNRRGNTVRMLKKRKKSCGDDKVTR